MRRLAVLLAPLFGCYVSHLDLPAEDAVRDAEERDAVDGRDGVDGPVDALPDGGPACRPAGSLEADELASHVGETLWVHGFWGPAPFFECTMGDPDECLAVDDVCCGTCESAPALYPERYAPYDEWPSAAPAVVVFWSPELPAPPPCSGSLCYRACTPWGRGTETWLHGTVRELASGGALEVVDPPCVGDGSPAPGTYRIIVRSMNTYRCPGAPALSGTTGTLYLWPHADRTAGELWLDAGAEASPRLLGRWVGDRLELHQQDRCDPCSCLYDLVAEFPDPGSVTGTVYVEASCACLSAFVFEGVKTSDEVALPGG